MSGNITLTSGIRQNLFSLQGTQNLLELTQSRLASGKKVQTALDDPINFFAAQGHQQRAGDLAGRKDEMGEAVQTVRAANNGIEAISTLIEAAKSLANSALSADTTTEASNLGAQFNTLLDQLDTLASDSGYKGINLLDGTNVTLQVKFDEKGDSNISLTGFNGSSGQAGGGGLGISDATTGAAATYWADASAVSTGAIDAAISDLDDAVTTLRAESKTLASNLSVITTRQDFTTAMINTLEDGAADLVNANMEEESANMLMLQTRQSLGISSLSMASQAAQSILKLF
jgi:flagellin-like hook-associated protein FlgL